MAVAEPCGGGGGGLIGNIWNQTRYMYMYMECSHTVEPPLKETPNKGQDSEHQNVTFL